MKRILQVAVLVLISLQPCCARANESNAESYTFTELHRKARTGTRLYFIGLALNYSLIPIAIATDPSDEAMMLFALPIAATHAMKLVGVPFACVQASRANDKCSGSELCRRRRMWQFYSAGWVCEGVGTVVALMGLAGNNMVVGISGIALFGIRDILWGISCHSAQRHIQAVVEHNKRSCIKIYPQFGLNGECGIGLSYDF